MLRYTDKRLKRLDRLLTGIKVIKAMVYEPFILDKMKNSRRDEVKKLQRYHLHRAIGQMLNFLFTAGATALTLVMVLGKKNTTEAINLVAVVSLFKLLRVQLNMIPTTLNSFADASISFDRIRKFLSTFINENLSNSDFAVSDLTAKSFKLGCKGRFLEINRGETVCVEGVIDQKQLIDLVMNLRTVGKVACCPQQPWLQNLSIRDNICSGLPYNESRYQAVLKATLLDYDIGQFGVERDLKIVSRDGLNISGGQRQRICLARALYSDASVWVFEDISCGLDTITATAVLENIKQLKPKNVTLFYLGPLENCDHVINIDSGFSRSHSSNIDAPDIAPSIMKELEFHFPLAQSKEVSRKGAIPWKTLKYWIKLKGGLWFIFFALLLLVLINQSRVGSEVMVAKEKDNFRLWLYILYCGGQIIGPFAMTFLFFKTGLRASNHLHNSSIKSLLETDYSHHVMYPISIILNRLGKDQETIDNALIISSAAFTVMCGVIFFTCLVMVTTRPLMTIPVFLIIFIYSLLAIYYRRSMREARRLECASRSPICQRALEAISGIEIIRGYGIETLISESIMKMVEDNCAYRYFLLTAQVWFTLRVEIMGALLTFTVGLIAAFTHLEATLAGLLLTFSSSLSGLTMWTIRQFIHTESNLIAVERVDNIPGQYPKEASGQVSIYFEEAPPLRLNEVSARFEKLEYLRGISVTFDAGKITALIGRTGSGKSSLLMNILGLYRTCSGSITFNSAYDLEHLDLNVLRSQIAYVAQEHHCFLNESVHYNLDPTGRAKYASAWHMLKLMRLNCDLDDIVDDSTPVSVQERLSVARALLRSNKIILMDEPFASVDSETLWAILNDPMFTYFLQDRTVIIATHRKQLIDFCDKVISMADGRIIDSNNSV